ncbi:MAG: hypothetical protein GXO23_05065 [Crenarchaeota archaeon]|nr:hypothetical protein [Thermoproteota archaeon]
MSIEKRKILTNLELCSNCGACIFTRNLSPCPQINIEEKLYRDPIPDIKRGYITRSTDIKILELAQDGGTVTSIVRQMLEKKVVNSALLLKLGRNLTPLPVVVRDPGKVLECAGSKYVYAPVLSKLGEAMREGPTLVVGLPCHIRAVSAIERELGGADVLKIGLLCSHNFRREMYIDLSRKYGFNIDNIVKMGIKKNMFRICLNNGNVIEVPLKELESYVLRCCRQCPELIPTYADLAVGSMFAPEKHNVVFVLSRRGEEILEMCHDDGVLEVMNMEDSVREKILKVCRRKAERALPVREEVVKLLKTHEISIT